MKHRIKTSVWILVALFSLVMSTGAQAKVTVTPDTTDITIAAGATFSVGVTASTDNNPTTGAQCQITGGPTYAWTADNNATVTPPDSSVGILSGSFATPGDYNVTATCNFNYTSGCGNIVDSGSAVIHAHVYAVTLQVRRTGVSDYSNSAILAANAGDLATGDLLMTMMHADGTPAVGVKAADVSINSADHVSVAPAASFQGVTDANGQITGSYTASDEVRVVTLSAGNASVTVDQHWNDLSDDAAWTYDPFFEAGVPSTISFTMNIHDATDLPLTGHSISFITSTLIGIQWDNDTQTWVDAEFDDADAVAASGYADLVSYADTTVTDCTYSTVQTINDAPDFQVTFVGFDAQDNATYDPDDMQQPSMLPTQGISAFTLAGKAKHKHKHRHNTTLPGFRRGTIHSVTSGGLPLLSGYLSARLNAGVDWGECKSYPAGTYQSINSQCGRSHFTSTYTANANKDAGIGCIKIVRTVTDNISAKAGFQNDILFTFGTYKTTAYCGVQAKSSSPTLHAPIDAHVFATAGYGDSTQTTASVSSKGEVVAGTTFTTVGDQPVQNANYSATFQRKYNFQTPDTTPELDGLVDYWQTLQAQVVIPSGQIANVFYGQVLMSWASWNTAPNAGSNTFNPKPFPQKGNGAMMVFDGPAADGN